MYSYPIITAIMQHLEETAERRAAAAFERRELGRRRRRTAAPIRAPRTSPRRAATFTEPAPGCTP